MMLSDEFTVTLHCALSFPSAVLAVITAVPSPTAVTAPPFTAATSVLLLSHITLLSLAFSGRISAVREYTLSSSGSVISAALREILSAAVCHHFFYIVNQIQNPILALLMKIS